MALRLTAKLTWLLLLHHMEGVCKFSPPKPEPEPEPAPIPEPLPNFRGMLKGEDLGLTQREQAIEALLGSTTISRAMDWLQQEAVEVARPNYNTGIVIDVAPLELER